MKRDTFYMDARLLEAYLKKYDRGVRTKDYEFHIALYAHQYFSRLNKQDYAIAFEVKDKPKVHPERMQADVETVKEVLSTYAEGDTPVDFALASMKNGKLDGIGYPYQVKKFMADAGEITTAEVADYINKKANNYRASEVTMIIVPFNKVDQKEPRGFNIAELKRKLKIDDTALHAVYVFQYVDGKAFFKPIWVSSRVTVVKTS